MTMRQMQARLLDGVRGRVVPPDDAGWDDARRSWNLSVDHRPAADVQAVLRSGLRAAPQATGHGPRVAAYRERAGAPTISWKPDSGSAPPVSSRMITAAMASRL